MKNSIQLERTGLLASKIRCEDNAHDSLDHCSWITSYKKIKQEAWDYHKAQGKSLNNFTSHNFNEEARPNMTKAILGIRDKYNGNLPVPFIGTPDAVWSPYTGTMTLLRRSKVDFPIADTKPVALQCRDLDCIFDEFPRLRWQWLVTPTLFQCAKSQTHRRLHGQSTLRRWRNKRFDGHSPCYSEGRGQDYCPMQFQSEPSTCRL